MWRCALVEAALLTNGAADAKESGAYIKDAEQYLAKGDLKSAAIELRNAVRQTPEDPTLHARLADILVRLGDFPGAEREARIAREQHGDEAAYLPVLAQALLRQQKFADILAMVKPGSRDPGVESKVRLALGLAEIGLNDQDKAEAQLREAVRLEDKAPGLKIALARFLASRNPAEAENLVDAALTVAPEAVDALQLKGELLRARGDADGAMRRFDAALKQNPNYIPARLSRANLNLSLIHI